MKMYLRECVKFLVIFYSSSWVIISIIVSICIYAFNIAARGTQVLHLKVDVMTAA
jgi:hypothetical protein